MPLHKFLSLHLDMLHTLSMHHPLSFVDITFKLTRLLIFSRRLSSEQPFPPKVRPIKQVALKQSQTFVVLFHGIRYFLKDMFVQIPVDQKLALEHNLLLSLLGNLISLLEHMLNLISPLIYQILDLLILITLFAATQSPRRKYHIFQLLLLLHLLLQRTHCIIISLPPRTLSFYFYSSHSPPSKANDGTDGIGMLRTRCL